MTVERESNNSSDTALNSNASLHNEADNELPKKKKAACCGTLKIFIIALSFSYFAKGLSGSYMKSSITQIERRFDIPSSLAGIIDGSFEMGNLLMIAFVSYFGSKFHRPKIIAAGCFLMAIGSFLTAMPHFFMGPYKYESSMTHETSLSNSTTNISPCHADLDQVTPANASRTTAFAKSDCEKEAGTNMWIYVLLGNMLRGVGETPITPLGLAYLDDFAKYENTPFYIGCVHTVAIIGPVFGFVLGSLCARLYVDIGFVDMDTVTITPQDTRWVGAWWLGFIVCAVVSLIAAIPFLSLPRSMVKEGESTTTKDGKEQPPSKEEHKMPNSENLQSQQRKHRISIKGFLKSIKRLLSNRLYVLFACILFLQVSGFIGFLTYKPKYMVQQYGQSISKSNFIIGVAVLPPISIGMFLGGLIMKKYKLGLAGTIKLAFATSFGAFSVNLLSFALGCQTNDVAGITVAYDGSKLNHFQESALFSSCNSDCRCSSSKWDPVCGDNGITYMSACLAGCTSSTGSGINMMYGNCSCIENENPTAGNFSVILGECPRGDDCTRMFLYFAIAEVISAFIYSVGGACTYVIIIRCVDHELKSLAVGIHMLVMRMLAGIPAPVYFGALIDMTCLKWGTKSCGDRGACRIYDSALYRNTFLGLNACLRAPSYLLYIPFLFMAKKHSAAEDAKQAEKTDMFTQEDIALKNNESSIVPTEDKETLV